MAEQSLKDKTIKGVAWSGIDNIAQYSVSFVVSIVLARLLSPDDYGLLGIIAIFTAVCTAIVNGGFTNALIRKKDVTKDDYNTAFIVNISISLLLYTIIYICSPGIANFFEREELILLTRVSSLGIIIGALSLVPQTLLTKRIDFKTQTKITLFASVMSGSTGIIMALSGCGVWSLVVQSLCNQCVRTISLWIYTHWIPSLRFSRTSFHGLFGFGWKMMISNIINTVWKELYQVVIGKYYSPSTLGQYTRATQFSQLFSSNLTNVIQRVTFPVLSDVQDNPQRMVGAYRRIIKNTMFITAIAMFFMGAISEPLLFCLIGEKWHDAAIYLPFICIAASTYPLHAINLNMLQVQGRSDLFLALEIIKKIVAIIPLCLGIFVGVIPMLLASIGVNIIDFFLNSYFTGRDLGYSSWQQVKDVAPSYGVALIVATLVWFLKFLPISYWLILPIQLLIGTAVIIIVCNFLRLEEYNEAKGIALRFISKLTLSR